MSQSTEQLPVVVIGAGPIGLAAAAHLVNRGMPTLVLEAGPCAGAAVSEWGHVRLFSAWSELIDPAARQALETSGWTAPVQSAYPTGAQWVLEYLNPLAETLGVVRYNHRVVAVARADRDRLVSSGRDDAAFVLHVRAPGGAMHVRAQAVIDASGTWASPNPLGSDGVWAIGEREAAARIAYRIPDMTSQQTRARYAGKHVVVAGTGASAKSALVALARLGDTGTRVTWLVRRANVNQAFAGSGHDELPQRGALGVQAASAVAEGPVTTVNGFRTSTVQAQTDARITLSSFDGRAVTDVDEVIALTGFRPDLSMLSEIRLEVDPIMQAPRQLAPLIDPNEHSCGTVYPHGAVELAHPETNFYVVGMKSYGRATSFLALTGFEQVRSVAAALAGDLEAAARVELTLPDTGVCGGAGDFDVAPESGCCAPSAS